MRNFYILGLLLICFSYSNAQSIGIRAGLNYSQIQGPVEPGESYGLTGGFHFGFNYGYKFSRELALRFELLYTQIGSKYSFDGDSYYVIYFSPDRTIYEPGKKEVNLNISTAYINLPVTLNYQLSKKFEVYGGLGMSFMVNPTGNGTLRFESHERPEGIVFRQGLDYRYFSDQAKGGQFLPNRILAIIVDENIVTLPRFAGAYYQFEEKRRNQLSFFDLNATIGINYFFNKGLFMGLRVDRGLLDVMRNDMHPSQVSYNPEGGLIFRDSKEINLGYQFSIGFRF